MFYKGFHDWTERPIVDPALRSMLAAVLENGIRAYQRGLGSLNGALRRESRDALKWIRSRDRREPFAFETVCINLGLAPSYIRRLALTMQPVRLRQRRRNKRRTRVRATVDGDE